jgi:hypothetical protein
MWLVGQFLNLKELIMNTEVSCKGFSGWIVAAMGLLAGMGLLGQGWNFSGCALLLGQVAAGWTFGQVIIAIIVIAACVGILLVACNQFGIQIPGFVIQIFWIVLCAGIAIFAIRLILGM